jgi:hypothetical protein
MVGGGGRQGAEVHGFTDYRVVPLMLGRGIAGDALRPQVLRLGAFLAGAGFPRTGGHRRDAHEAVPLHEAHIGVGEKRRDPPQGTHFARELQQDRTPMENPSHVPLSE